MPCEWKRIRYDRRYPNRYHIPSQRERERERERERGLCADINSVSEGRNFEVKWVQDCAFDQQQGSPSHIEEECESDYESEELTRASPSSVTVQEILLLTSEKQLTRRVVMKELAEYISVLIGVIEKVMQNAEPPEDEEAPRQPTQQQQQVVAQVNMHESGRVSVELQLPSVVNNKAQQVSHSVKRVATFPSSNVMEELRERMERVSPAALLKDSNLGASPESGGGGDGGEGVVEVPSVQFQIIFLVERRR